MPYPINNAHRLALEDGTSLLLLEDNTSKIILDEQIALDDPLNAGTVSSVTPGLTFVGQSLPGFALSDQFASTSLDTTKWTQFTAASGTATYATSGASLNYPNPTSTSNDADITSVGTFDLTGNTASLQVLNAPSGANSDATFKLKIDATHDVHWQNEGTNLFAAYVNGSQTILATLTYNSTTHKWWRIRESGGTTFWDTSADNVVWTNQASVANPITLTKLNVQMAATSFGADSGLTAFKFNNFSIKALTYEIQVDTVNTFDSGLGGSALGSVITSYSETNSDGDTAINLTPTNRTSVGQSFTGTGAAIGAAKFYLSIHSTATGTATAKIYAESHATAFGTDSVPTGAALATSDNFDVSSLSASKSLATFTFSGANKITLTNGTNYVLAFEYIATGTDWIDAGRDASSPTATGNISVKNAGTWAAVSTQDLCFYLYDNSGLGSPLLDKTSDLNTGFIDDTAGETTEPHLMLEDGTSFLLLEDNASKLVINEAYPSGDYLTYTVPAATLSNGVTYYWRARQKVQNGGAYTSWSEIRSFTVSTSTGPSVSDTLTLSENVVKMVESYVNVNDTLTTSENVLRMVESYVSASDTLTASENVVTELNSSANKSDTITLSENVSLLIPTLNVSVSDTMTLTENVVKEVNSFVNVSDTLTTSENVLRTSVDNLSVSDTLTLSENTQFQPESYVNASDTLTTSENVIKLLTSFVSASDTLTTSESVQETLAANATVSDSLTLSENVQLLDTDNISVNDSLTLSENTSLLVPTLLISVSDSLTFTESISLLDTDNIAASDTLTFTESTVQLLTSFISTNDPLTLSESTQLLETSFINVNDTLTASESSKLELNSFVNKSDTLTFTENVQLLSTDNITVSDTLSLSENTSLLIPTLFISVSDTLTFTESVQLLDTDNIIVSDNLTLSESTVQLLTSSVVASDTLTTSESVKPELNSAINKSDTITLSENVVVSSPPNSFSIVKSDTMTLNESVRVHIEGTANAAPRLVILTSGQPALRLGPTLYLPL